MSKEKESYTNKKLRKITLTKPVDASYGFSIVLDDDIGRYTVKNVIKDSISDQNGIKVGDIVYEINEFLLDQLSLQEILGVLQNSKQHLSIAVVSQTAGVDPKSFITRISKNKKFYKINSERIDISNEKVAPEKKDKFCLLRRMSVSNRARNEHKYSIPISPPPPEASNRIECDLSSSECSCQGIPSSNSCGASLETSSSKSNKFDHGKQKIEIKLPQESANLSTELFKMQDSGRNQINSPTEVNKFLHRQVTFDHKMKNIPLKDIEYRSFRDVNVSDEVVPESIGEAPVKNIPIESRPSSPKKSVLNIIKLGKNFINTQKSWRIEKHKSPFTTTEKVVLFKNLQ